MGIEAMKERIDEMMEARQKLWIAACEADGIDPAASFVVFSEGNQAAQEHNELVREILDLIEKRNRAIQAQAAKALKAARARRLRRAAAESLGLRAVRGAVTGATYYE